MSRSRIPLSQGECFGYFGNPCFQINPTGPRPSGLGCPPPSGPYIPHTHGSLHSRAELGEGGLGSEAPPERRKQDSMSGNASEKPTSVPTVQERTGRWRPGNVRERQGSRALGPQSPREGPLVQPRCTPSAGSDVNSPGICPPPRQPGQAGLKTVIQGLQMPALALQREIKRNDSFSSARSVPGAWGIKVNRHPPPQVVSASPDPPTRIGGFLPFNKKALIILFAL